MCWCRTSPESLPNHAPRWIIVRDILSCLTYLLACLLILPLICSAQQQILSVTPRITQVSAMCTNEGITAQVMFDGNFMGKIYSHRYGTVHDCVYYNVYDMQMILFDIPNYKCGTRLTRGIDNRVNHIENEVYIQFDKDTQSVDDKRYLFVCDLAPNIDFSGTVNPSRTVIVQTIEPTRIFITQEGIGGNGLGGGDGGNPPVTMSIRDGNNPLNPPVSRTLRLGDYITLVVTASQFQNNINYNMFVHSCFASDGGGTSRIELIDRAGCAVRDRIVDPLQRQQNGVEETYWFTMRAFKFPSSDDVYFSCSVDICRDCNFAEICPASGIVDISTNRLGKRSIGYERTNASALVDHHPGADRAKMEELTLHDFVKFEAETDFAPNYNRSKNEPGLTSTYGRRAVSSTHPFCFTTVSMVCLMSTFAMTLLALIAMTVFVITMIHGRRSSGRKSGSGEGGISTASSESGTDSAVRYRRYSLWSAYRGGRGGGGDNGEQRGESSNNNNTNKSSRPSTTTTASSTPRTPRHSRSTTASHHHPQQQQQQQQQHHNHNHHHRSNNNNNNNNHHHNNFNNDRRLPAPPIPPSSTASSRLPSFT